MSNHLGLLPLLLVGLAASLPSTALAIDFEIINLSSTGASTTTLLPGDVITIDFNMNNPDNTPISYFEVAAFGHDIDTDNVADDGLEFFGGSATSSILNATVDPIFGPLGGLANFISPPREIGTSAPGSSGAIPRGLTVLLFGVVGVTEATGDGSNDIGVDGGLVGSGDAHFRAMFRAAPVGGPTPFTLHFGIDDRISVVGNNTGTLPYTNTSHSLTVIPEPGTGLLTGAGLALLAMTARRRRTPTA